MSDNIQCFCCGRTLEAEPVENEPLTISPIYDGLIFRASGNFGSRIFDPISIEEYLQVIICDDCIKRNVKRVTRIHNIERVTTSVVESFDLNRS